MNEINPLEQLRKNGYKITPQRQEILKALHDDPKPWSAEEIHRKIVSRYPNMSLDTIYRNIAILLEIGLVRELNFRDGKNRFEINRTGSHHHHLVCLKCGSAEAVDFCPFTFLDQNKILNERKFEIKEHSFEIFGYCSMCRS